METQDCNKNVPCPGEVNFVQKFLPPPFENSLFFSMPNQSEKAKNVRKIEHDL